MSSAFWSEQLFLRPLFIDDASWQKIIGNFLGSVGDPVNDLMDALQDDLERLGAMGQGWSTLADIVRRCFFDGGLFHGR